MSFSYQSGSSQSNLLEMLHGGRPRNEEPHVKKSMKKHGEKVDLILRVDLDELGISEDEFDDLQSLFQLYDHDKDGILNLKETQKVLRCLGFRTSEDQAKSLARLVSCDRHGYSISFNEYLRLVSIQRKEEPDGDRLLEAFQSVFFSYQLLFGSCFLVRSFDPTSSGVISEEHFRKIMRSKESVDEEDINEMIREYRQMQTVDVPNSRGGGEPVIIYKDFISMLQQ